VSALRIWAAAMLVEVFSKAWRALMVSLASWQLEGEFEGGLESTSAAIIIASALSSPSCAMSDVEGVSVSWQACRVVEVELRGRLSELELLKRNGEVGNSRIGPLLDHHTY
jgi:hypothetical protein